MAIFEILSGGFKKIEETSFSSAGIRERADLQRLLRSNIEVISPDTLIISEEFSEWEDCRRRIDLLGIDKDANLVVIELKRTEDGGHMDLQAIRYAAMVSAMTFERAVEAFSEFLNRSNSDALSSILEFLEWGEPDEDSFGQNVRILLAAADFSKELTTTVMWLNDQGLDIRCVRIKPYLYGEQILADVQQVIPLPEADEYRVRIKEKQLRERAARKFERDFTKFDVTINGKTHTRLPKRTAIYSIVKYLCDSGISPQTIIDQIPWKSNSLFRCAEGTLDSATFLQKMRQDQEAGGRAFDELRFYCADDELIHADGRTFAFTNQWGQSTIRAINNLLQTFPEHHITCIQSEERS